MESKIKKTFRTLAKLAARAAANKKATDIRVFDVRQQSDIADYLVIAGAESSTQLRAIHEGILAGLRDQGLRAHHQEAHPRDRWMALDYGGIVVHIFLPEARSFYRLEKMWEGSPIVPWKERASKKNDS